MRNDFLASSAFVRSGGDVPQLLAHVTLALPSKGSHYSCSLGIIITLDQTMKCGLAESHWLCNNATDGEIKLGPKLSSFHEQKSKRMPSNTDRRARALHSNTLENPFRAYSSKASNLMQLPSSRESSLARSRSNTNYIFGHFTRCRTDRDREACEV